MNKTAFLNDSHAPRQQTSLCVTDLPLRDFLVLCAALLSVSAYPALFVYCHNIKEAVFTQIFSPILLYAAIGFAAWLLFWIMTAKMSKGAFIALLFLLVFMNYSLLEDGIRVLIPDWRWWRIAPTFLFLFINLALFLRIFIRQSEADAVFTRISFIIGAVFLALTLFNAARAGFTLAGTSGGAPQEGVSLVKTEVAPNSGSPGRRPNFYFFIFDEYARQDILKQYAGYDNAPFLQGLERKKFNVSYSSYASGILTHVSIGNRLHYFPKYSTPEKAKRFDRPPLFDLFKKAGYKVYSLSPVCAIGKALVDVELKDSTVLPALSINQTVLAASFIDYVQQHDGKTLCKDRLGLLKQASAIIKKKRKTQNFYSFILWGPMRPFSLMKMVAPLLMKIGTTLLNPNIM